MAWVWLSLLGGVGAVARLRVDAAIGGRSLTDFPVGTFVVNVVGSFALGALTGAHIANTAMFVLGTGLLGSFTTFSTWMFEAQRLAEDGETTVALGNLAVGIAAGAAAAALGWALGAVS